MTRKDAASREEMLGMVLGGSVAGHQLRHSAADRQLLQGLAQVFLAGENAGHSVQRLTDLNFFVRSVDAGIVQAVMDKSMADQKRETAQKRRELAQAERRISDLDVLFQRIYEDNISGKLSDERFSKLSKSYEDEQRTLTEKAKALHAELDKEQAQAVNVAQFIALVKKYSEIDTLTPAILNEFIERINVHAPDKSSGHRTQQIDIVYNFIGILPTPQAKEEAA